MRVTCAVVLLIAVGSNNLGAADFNRDVAPVLIRRCLECHKGTEPSGGLSLESAAAIKQGGESGVVVVSGEPEKSYLLERITSGEMPPPVKGVAQPLPESERRMLRAWIAEGAKWPKGRTLDLYEVTTDVRGGRDWWSFQPVQRPQIPRVQNQAVVANPIDAFVIAKLEKAQMQPAERAELATIVRRVFYDVTGLPPTFDELNLWSKRIDETGNAAPLIDHLLSTPQFGERWARYWLDLVRYAETSGYERDQPKPFAWKYRDWVVNAINRDMPYDQFIRNQLAGDEIRSRSEQSVIATGFLRLGTWNDEPNDNADYLYDRLEDMVHSTSSAFLGLTVKCARCHDHKFDPIPQDDYYRIASAFWPGPIAARDRALLGGPSADELGVKNVLGWTDLSSKPSPLHVLKNGERHKPLHAVEPGTLTFVASLYRPFTLAGQEEKTSGRRRQLAEWIASPENPLTARVFVNRLWLHHFGEGLVRSPNNFGYKGELPTHPQLLDWLAAEFIDSGWSAKHIHRLILNSRTWQKSVQHPKASEYSATDSSNEMWWRSNRRRLDAEALRDSMLAAAGELDLSVGGPGFKPTISEEALEGFSRKSSVWKPAPPDQQRRRSLYIFVSRSLMPPMMTTFDQCDTTLPCAQRDVTTVAPQALAMMNNQFTHDRSAALASRIEKAHRSVEDQVAAAWKLVLSRLPRADEKKLSLQHLRSQFRRFQNPSSASTPIGSETDLPKAVLHLAADSGVQTSEENRVKMWKSVQQHTASQNSASAQPAFVAEAINGRPALRFNGKGQFLRISGEVLSQESCSIIAVVRDRATKPGLREIISNWNGAAGNSTSSVFLGLRDSGHVRFSDQFSPAGEISDRSKPFILTAVNGADGARLWQNTALIGSRAQPLSGRRFGTEWVIGQQGNINGEFWHGDIAEVIVFDRPFTDAQLKNVWALLHEKYGIPQMGPGVSPEGIATPEHLALASLCHVLLNSNEFLYVD